MSILDLNGKVVFKIKLGNEIKKIVNHNDELTYNELCVMIQRIYSERINKNDEFTLKYTDEDNDLITIESDSDVILAIQTNKILRLTIYLKNGNDDGLMDKLDAKNVNSTEIVKELQTIRQSIDKFLEKFEYLIKIQENDNQQKQAKAKPIVNDTKATNSIENKMPNLNIIETHKEFDPLANKKSSRAGTPDSISSLTSSPSQRKVNSNQEPQQQQQQDAPKQQSIQYLNQALMNSFQTNLDSTQQPKLNNLIPSTFIPPPQHQQQLQSQMLPQTPQQQQQPQPQQQQQLQMQQNSYQANMYQGFPQQAQTQPQQQQQQPTTTATIQTQYAAHPSQLAQQQQQQAQLTEQQYMQYMQQQQFQQQQQLQNQNYQQQMSQTNPYSKTTGLNQRYPTPTNFQQAYK